ncbi:hypothetical protein [Kozakia baliensis]|uniref:hypothetical protein n=1 Tax=Kozakia baliensis TaxID=153496 RepID=UPI001267EC01|nr:hypothetical protein [Kozakia baliensis]
MTDRLHIPNSATYSSSIRAGETLEDETPEPGPEYDDAPLDPKEDDDTPIPITPNDPFNPSEEDELFS